MNNDIMQYMDYAVGALFILFHTGSRFNTPPTNRSSTTAVRYHVALTAYSGFALAIYLVLAYFPNIINYLTTTAKDAAVPDWAKGFSPPLVSALVMTLLLPKIPILSAVDNWICKNAQNMAAIPFEVRRLIAELRKASYHLRPEDEETLRQRLQEEGFDPSDILLGSKGCPQHLWTQVAALVWRIEDWESDRKTAGYVAAAAGEFQRLRRTRQQLAPKAKTCFRLIKESGGGHASEKAHEAVLRFKEDFVDQLSVLLNETLEFVARGVLQCELTDAARNNRLHDLGYDVHWTHEPLTLNQLMSLFSLLVVLLLFVFIVSSGGKGKPILMLLLRAATISVSYVVGVACVVFPKEKWAIARYRAGDAPPITFYVLAGIMAVFISQAFMILINGLAFMDMHKALERFLYLYPWSTMTFFTSIITGLLTDNIFKLHTSNLRRRLLEGLIQAGTMVLVAAFVWHWLTDTTSCAPQGLDCRAPDLFPLMAVTSLIGFAIGATVPTWHRHAPRQITPIDDDRVETRLLRTSGSSP
jgi:hypothetical protein